MRHSMLRVALVALASLAARPAGVGAHAFLDRAEPRVGSQVRESPGEVKVWMTEEIEPAFSSLQVFDASGKQVDRKDVRRDARDKKLLIVSVPKLPDGEYKAVWNVVATDTHRTHGDFKFTVKVAG